MTEHRWVRHTVVPVGVTRVLQGGEDEFQVTRPDDAVPLIVVGCDNCGLPLSSELFEEPCLSSLEDQLEEQMLTSGEQDDKI